MATGIAMMPAGSAAPTFKHPEVVGQDLSLKLGIRLTADDQDFQQESTTV